MAIELVTRENLNEWKRKKLERSKRIMREEITPVETDIPREAYKVLESISMKEGKEVEDVILDCINFYINTKKKSVGTTHQAEQSLAI